MSRILITGASGFIGKLLAKALLQQGHIVFGLGFRRNSDELLRFFNWDWPKDFSYEEIDILDPSSLQGAFDNAAPEFIYHLAAVANIPISRQNPVSTLRTNVEGSHNVLLAAGKIGVKGIHLASSSDVYGPTTAKEQPISELQPRNPQNVYAVSKASMEDLGKVFWEGWPQMAVVVTRLFTTTGVGQYTDAAVSYFAYQAAKVKLGQQEPEIRCGNVNNYRSILDIDDVIQAFLVLPKIGRGDIYEDTILNISGTYEVCLKNIITEILSSIVGEPLVVERHTLQRRNVDVSHQVGDSSGFAGITGWEPRIPFEETVRKVYQYWLKELQR